MKTEIPRWLVQPSVGGAVLSAEQFRESRVAALRLLGSVRTIGMSPHPDLGYDPVPLIRAGEKCHTLRGTARIVGQIAQAAVGPSKVRIPLWLRWTDREKVTFGECFNDEFAYADGFRADDIDRSAFPHPRPPLTWATWAMQQTFVRFSKQSAPPAPEKQMWLCHFTVALDLMSDPAGLDEWDLEALLEREGVEL